MVYSSQNPSHHLNHGHDLNRTVRHFSSHRHHSGNYLFIQENIKKREISECGFRCTDGSCVKSHHKCDGI